MGCGCSGEACEMDADGMFRKKSDKKKRAGSIDKAINI